MIANALRGRLMRLCANTNVEICDVDPLLSRGSRWMRDIDFITAYNIVDKSSSADRQKIMQIIEQEHLNYRDGTI